MSLEPQRTRRFAKESTLSLARLFFFFGAAIFFTQPVFAQCEMSNLGEQDSSMRPDRDRAIEFLHRLRSAVQKDDRVAVARLIRYPLLISSDGKKGIVRTRAEFLRKYTQIFTPALKCELDSANDDDVWGNYKGFTFNRGAIWWEAKIDPNVGVDNPDFWKKGVFSVRTVNGAWFEGECAKRHTPINQKAGTPK